MKPCSFRLLNCNRRTHSYVWHSRTENYQPSNLLSGNRPDCHQGSPAVLYSEHSSYRISASKAMIPTSEGFAIVMTASDNLRKPGKLQSGMTCFDEPQTTLKLVSLSTGGRAPLQQEASDWSLCEGYVWVPMPGL